MQEVNDFFIKIKEKGYDIESSEEYFYEKNEKLRKNIMFNIFENIKKLELIKDKEFIQEVINSNYFLLCEYIPDSYKLNKKILNNLIFIFNKKNKIEKKEILKKICETNNEDLDEIQLKLKYFYIFSKNYNFYNGKEQNIINKLNTEKTFEFLKQISLKNKKEKQIYVRQIAHKIEEIKKEPLYNNELYDLQKNNKISRDKYEIIKNAYFFKGLNITDFKDNMQNELYNCNNEQLQNYINVFIDFKEGYITNNEFYFSKNIINENSLTQKELKEEVLPIIKNYNLSQTTIRECISISSQRNYGDITNFLNLAITAKEHNYSDTEILILLKDSKENDLENTKLKIDLIKEFGNCEKTKISNIINKNNYQLIEILNNNINETNYISN